MAKIMGKMVEDSVTGFKGIVIAKCEHLNGCVQYEVRPQGVDEKGQMKESVWIDEQQLVPQTKKKTKDKPGGPASSPPKTSGPK